MPSILNEITFFQFDNLIRNRIPFVILNLGVNLQSFYSSPLYQGHLESISINSTKDSALAELLKKNLQKHDAILILCADGNMSSQLVDSLETQGYSNVFFAKNGYDSLRADATH